MMLVASPNFHVTEVWASGLRRSIVRLVRLSLVARVQTRWEEICFVVVLGTVNLHFSITYIYISYCKELHFSIRYIHIYFY